MPRLVLDIADFPIALSIPSPRLAARARRRYRAFLGRGRPRLTIDLALAPAGIPHPLPVPRVSAGPGGSLRILRRGDFRADLDLARGAGAGRVRNDLMSLDNLLRVVHAAVLLRRGGLLSHAAGIRLGRRAWLFPGVSGRGKSTLAALAGRRRVLSDELTAVRREGKRFLAMGTPFWGSFEEGRLNRTVALAGLAFLRRPPSPALAVDGSRLRRAARRSLGAGGRPGRPGCRPIPAGDAARRLLRVAMCFERDKKGLRLLLANTRALVRSLPTVELAFDRRRPFAEVARALACHASGGKKTPRARRGAFRLLPVPHGD